MKRNTLFLQFVPSPAETTGFHLSGGYMGASLFVTACFRWPLGVLSFSYYTLHLSLEENRRVFIYEGKNKALCVWCNVLQRSVPQLCVHPARVRILTHVFFYLLFYNFSLYPVFPFSLCPFVFFSTCSFFPLSFFFPFFLFSLSFVPFLSPVLARRWYRCAMSSVGNGEGEEDILYMDQKEAKVCFRVLVSKAVHFVWYNQSRHSTLTWSVIFGSIRICVRQAKPPLYSPLVCSFRQYTYLCATTQAATLLSLGASSLCDHVLSICHLPQHILFHLYLRQAAAWKIAPKIINDQETKIQGAQEALNIAHDEASVAQAEESVAEKVLREARMKTTVKRGDVTEKMRVLNILNSEMARFHGHLRSRQSSAPQGENKVQMEEYYAL